MKKNQRKTRKSSKKYTQQSNTPTPNLPPIVPPVQMHRRLWLAAKVIAGFLVALAGLVGSIYGIWGPPWPTEPVFVPGPPSSGSPFGIPFNVTNKSVLFSLNNVSFECHIFQVRTEYGEVSDLGIAGTGSNVLKPGETRPYFCKFDLLFKIGRILAADIAFKAEYDGWLSKGRIKTTTGHFVLNAASSPPHWMQGAPLK